MSELVDAINAFVDHAGGGEGHFALPMPGAHVIRTFRQVEANHALYRPSLCVVAQGAKQFLIGEETLNYGVHQGLIVTLDLPACGRIVAASPDEPFVSVAVDIDPAILREVIDQTGIVPQPSAPERPAATVADLGAPLIDCVTRLVNLWRTPQAIPVLYPAILREIHYWLVVGPQGAEVCRQLAPDTHLARVSKAIWLLRQHYAEPLPVERLAEAAGMSLSSFHHHFKALTSMTPLQFQKQLRLLEARRLMLSDASSVTDAAYRVGYESPSQFSREYSRAFGSAPKRDAQRMRTLQAELMSV